MRNAELDEAQAGIKIAGRNISNLRHTSLVAQTVKHLPAMQETWVRSVGWEGLLQEGKATYSSILSWRIPRTIQSMGLQRVGYD